MEIVPKKQIYSDAISPQFSFPIVSKPFLNFFGLRSFIVTIPEPTTPVDFDAWLDVTVAHGR